ncbi:MAG TPA: peptidoglycan-binding protein [Ruminiclostridium sp.]|nr:peptidoglycan-binding protein [Ruminiclostridium sp.]
MYSVIFKHPDQAYIYPKLLSAVNRVCSDYKNNAECSSGYRSLQCQKDTAKLVLAQYKDSYQLEDGSVYIGTGSTKKCLAAAYGKSNHCFCIAMDINGWFEKLTNEQLKKYGLIKPIPYEPWHVQLIEHTGISEEQKIFIRNSCLKEEGLCMNIKEFQAMTGLQTDGISGPKTQSKAKEVLQVCQQILGYNFKTAEEIIKKTQNNPEFWLPKLKEIKYFDSFIMNIVKLLGGRN